MTTFYVDNNLVLRAHPNGWPETPKFPLTQYTSGFWDDYFKAIARAKVESLPVEGGVSMPVAIHDAMLIAKPDTFVELPIEVEFESICTRGSCVHGDAGCYADGMPGEKCSARQVARLKPQAKSVADSALPDANDKDVASIKEAVCSPNELTALAIKSITVNRANFEYCAKEGIINGGLLADLRHILQPLYMELAAANARIKELEASNAHYLKLIDKYAGIK